jgi:hypothetical protein
MAPNGSGRNRVSAKVLDGGDTGPEALHLNAANIEAPAAIRAMN